MQFLGKEHKFVIPPPETSKDESSDLFWKVYKAVNERGVDSALEIYENDKKLYDFSFMYLEEKQVL